MAKLELSGHCIVPLPLAPELMELIMLAGCSMGHFDELFDGESSFEDALLRLVAAKGGEQHCILVNDNPDHRSAIHCALRDRPDVLDAAWRAGVCLLLIAEQHWALGPEWSPTFVRYTSTATRSILGSLKPSKIKRRTDQ